MKNYIIIFSILALVTSCQQPDGPNEETSPEWTCDGDCENGTGVKTWWNYAIEKGEWKDGKLHGVGSQFFVKEDRKGDWYEGDWIKGEPNGAGTYFDASEDRTYSGEFKNGVINGKGKRSCGPNSRTPGAWSEGEWKNGKRHGYCVYFLGTTGEFANNKYAGEWKDDYYHGIGKYEWPDGSSYEGEWVKDTKHGKGIATFSDSSKFEGIWVDGTCEEFEEFVKNK